MARRFVRKGATDEQMHKELRRAARRGDIGTFQRLVQDYDYDVNAVAKTGATALMVAAERGHLAFVRYLAGKCEADVNITDEDGDTALMKAVEKGNCRVVRYLAGDCNADVYITNLGGYSALTKAAAKGQMDIVRYLAGECVASSSTLHEYGVCPATIAAEYGHIDVVRYLFEECGVDVNATSTTGCTAVMKAAECGHGDTVRCLAEEYRAALDIPDERGTTALIAAAANGHLGIVEYLAGNVGVDVNASSNTGTTVLMAAAARGHSNIVHCLLAGDYGVDLEATDENDSTLLMVAAGGGSVEVVRHLAEECGAEINATNIYGLTALMIAAQFGHFEIVRYLAADCGADVNISNISGSTALMVAAQYGHIGIIQYLERAADTNATTTTGATALILSSAEGHVDVVRYLVAKCGSGVNDTDKYGDTALMKAAAGGHIDCVRCIALEFRAHVNGVDKYGDSALMKAAAGGYVDVLRCLVSECRADVNATNNTRSTALMLAAAKGHSNVARYLAAECWADVNCTNLSGTTALMIAAQYGHVDIVQCLKEFGADVNATNRTGTTALMIAAHYGHLDVARFITSHCGADVNMINGDGYTATRIAAEHGYQEIQRVFTPFVMVEHPKVGIVHVPSRDVLSDQTSSWSIPPSEIALIEFVESGNIGGEYRAKWLDADAAVKLFIPDASSLAAFENELQLWHQLRHPNVIKMYGACDASPLLLQFFVFEYADNGSLLEYVTSRLSTNQKTWSFLHQAALGLEYLHERGIIHGDLRCRSILIGSDGLAKLANFGRSDGSQSFELPEKSARVGSMRWQSPEVLEGGPRSFASDVYSLGMCILEAMTKKMPWANEGIDYKVRTLKKNWAPENSEHEDGAPMCLTRDARRLVWAMCCRNPDKRATLSAIVDELDHIASKASAAQSENTSTFDNVKCGKMKELWLDLQMRIENCTNDLCRQHFDELKQIRERIQESLQPITMLDQFHTLIRDFRQSITMSREQSLVQQLSATRATTASVIAFRRRLRALWTALGESADAARVREIQWEKQRRQQIEIFVSEASKTYLVLEELKSQEERLAFAARIKIEIGHPSKYTAGQLSLLQKAYEDIVSRLETNNLSILTPEWFIPWYELIVDQYNALGHGGFGSVFRAKWLNSDVVVKHLIGSGSEIDMSSSMSYFSSVQPPGAVNTKRVEVMEMFRREVAIWFGFSHPHVIRLFGACHVGRPFFVCEYATNGTLVSYLRNHPQALWSQLHEAALGVQYLHARGVVHGDLKGNNIVIGSDKKAKVTDFGLSSIISDESKSRISCAAHWVAPECFAGEDARPTFASDIYSLGMCIVEALRVAEPTRTASDLLRGLPWGVVGNDVVRYHVKRGKLPPRPAKCAYAQWQLVQRMCAFEPEKRLKISTVVDELAAMANNLPNTLAGIRTEASVILENVHFVIAAARRLFSRLQDDNQEVAAREGKVDALYSSLWDRLEQVYYHIRDIRDTLNYGSRTTFCCLVADANDSTKRLQDKARTLVSLAETALQCYALHRRLDKYVEANFLSPAYLNPGLSAASEKTKVPFGKRVLSM
ncbi:Leucine-rich repeat serine/threonine-protein kinase 2 [Phytophthora pseudosyringae]|uniref:Leucine-rich repeat serine/threonine-protein kinase 2 n=1 Tax=Phytophthora pseudosyringae TaxID=221518 RepID=A0A8T1V5Z8_9STRA|nr:Leucine-rich repeat serine/threonine-protein kinase 2 [Phytophthora pseudosyringae]